MNAPHRIEPTVAAPGAEVVSETKAETPAAAPERKAARRKERETVETPPQRLVRVRTQGPSLIERAIDGLRAMAYKSGIYRMHLRGAFPLKLQVAPADPWPGDAPRGALILAGQLERGGISMNSLAVRFRDVDAPPVWFDWVNGFRWLRDLEAAAADIGQGASVTERIVKLWLADFGKFEARAWQPAVIGERLLMWIGHAPLLLSSTDQVYRSAVLTHMARASRHLSRTAERAADGLPRLKALTGLIGAGLVLPGRESLAGKAAPQMEALLARFVLPDGGLSSRCPEEMLLVLQLLVTLRSLYAARQMEPPHSIVQAMDRLVPALRGLILGDGRLARFHGGGTATIDAIERALAAATDGSRQPVRNAVHSGYQRLEGGKAILVADAGPPPPGRLSARAHAGSLSFEFSDGAQRLIINCGNEFEQPGALPQALRDSLRGTSAHSTLSIDDVNSTVFRSDGLLGKGVGEITAVRQENGEGSWLDMVHDGYVARFGYAHRRRIFLSAEGFDLRGEELLEPQGRRREVQPVTIRFHLAPGVMAIPTQGNSSAALKLPNGTAWMFRCRGASLAIAESLAIEEGVARKCQQLVLSAQAQPSGNSINWLFQRGK